MHRVGPTPGVSRRRPAHQPPRPENIGGSTLPAQIHDALEESIIEGVLAPGARLHADKLALRYGVSRIPVREALRSLHEAGWVEIRPRYGVYVRDRSAQELHQLVESRSLVESALAAWAAQRRSDADVAALRDVVRRSRRAADDGDRDTLLRLSAAFAAAVRATSGNTVLAGISAGLEKRARFYFSMVAGDLGGDWVAVHERLVDLIAGGDAEGARAEARRHILDTGRAVADLLGRASPTIPD